MKTQLPTADQPPVPCRNASASPLSGAGSRRAFSLVEVLIVVTLLALIVLVLTSVFNSTQAAFRAGVTQTDVLEGGRAAMDLMVSDLKLMAASGGTSNFNSGGVNFVSLNNTFATTAYVPLFQNLTGSDAQRTNLLSYYFFLGKQNTTWTGIGYAVNSSSQTPLYPLYRFFAQTNIQVNPMTLYAAFTNDIYYQQWTNMSHLIDGVVDLRVHPFDNNGYQMTNSYSSLLGQVVYPNTFFITPPYYNEFSFFFFSNTLPASVDVQMGILEDHTRQRAESLSVSFTAQTNYLAQQAGRVHIFRQHVVIPNADPTVYQ